MKHTEKKRNFRKHNASRRRHRHHKRVVFRKNLGGGETEKMYNNKKVLVTGGAGFIGSNLVDQLLQEGAFVRVLDNLTTGKMDNLINAEKTEKFEFFQGDVRNPEDCAKACKDIDVVFHEAALVSVPLSMTEPLLNHEINVTGTLNMLIAAANSNVKRFVYASSAATYGDPPEVPKMETMARQYPSPYALSKGVDEDYATLWAYKPELGRGMTCVGLRYFNVFGPRQDPKSPYSGVISIFTDRIKNEQPITIFGDGTNTRDFVFVGDVVQANILAGIRPLMNDVKSNVYNVGTGISITLNELVNTMKTILQKEVQVNYQNARAGDILHSLANVDKISGELGYSPKYTLNQGLTILLQ
jgi:UDP-N-acetylglucosamine 4-epimerase